MKIKQGMNRQFLEGHFLRHENYPEEYRIRGAAPCGINTMFWSGGKQKAAGHSSRIAGRRLEFDLERIRF